MSGLPFIGRAGDLLESMLTLLCEEGVHFSYGITNVVSCFPFTVNERSGKKQARVPSKDEAAACRLRLHTTIEAANPGLIVLLGNTAKKYVKPPKTLLNPLPPVISIMHPAGILRRGGKNSLDYKRNYFDLKDHIEQFLAKKTTPTNEATLET